MPSFSHPYYLLLLLILPIIVWWQRRKPKDIITLPFPQAERLYRIAGKHPLWDNIILALRLLTLFCLIIAIARPRWGIRNTEINGKGIDIIFAMDVSGSMKAVDFKPINRLEAAKQVAMEFVQSRKSDRLGLVVFSEYALTQCPLTMDYDIVRYILKQVQVNEDAGSTAIGMGLATAVSRLKNSQARSKVIILITDGMNNTGEIDPIAAAEMAKTFKIKVYPVGVGSYGLVDYPMEDPILGVHYVQVKIDMDMDTLNKIASITGTGNAALATSTDELKEILHKINQLEKTPITQRQYYRYRELFPWMLFFATLSLLSELVLRLVWRKVLI